MKPNRAFVEDGREVEVLAKISVDAACQFVVRYISEEDDEPHGKPCIVNRYFESAPTDKIDDVIMKRRNRLSELTDILEAKQTELKAIEEKIREQTSSLKSALETKDTDAALARVYQFISGKITHVVIRNGYQGPSIQVVGSEDTADRWKDGLRILSLVGAENRQMRWILQKDGSRDPQEVIPCLSKQDAIEIAMPMYVNLCRESINSVDNLARYIANAAKYGVMVPQEFVDRLAILRKTDNEKKREQITGQIAKLQGELAQLG